MFTIFGTDEYKTNLDIINVLLGTIKNNDFRMLYLLEFPDLKNRISMKIGNIQEDLIKYRGILEQIDQYDNFRKKFVYIDNENALRELNSALNTTSNFLKKQSLLISDLDKLNQKDKLLRIYKSNETKTNTLLEDINNLEYDINNSKKILSDDINDLNNMYVPIPDIQFNLDNNHSFVGFVVILIVLFITTVAAIAKFISYRKNKKIRNEQEKKLRTLSKSNPIIF